MTSDCAVCYVSDINFLLPSLISAVGVRAYVPPPKADIFIFTAGVDPAKAQEIDHFMQPHSIHIQAMDESVFKSIDRSKFLKNDTPMAMLGRLVMDEFLPPSAKRIVYIDGDTWIARDPSQLIDAVVPEGLFAAAEDTISLRQNFPFGAATRKARDYFKKLGLHPKQGYFNSGVFAVSRSTWKTIAREAFDFYRANMEACQYSQDQCALNAVAGDRRLRLSNKWNFQTQLKIWGAERYTEPTIYHFNRYPKPWMCACEPWTNLYETYLDAAAPFENLKLPLKKLDANESAALNAQVEKSYGYLRLPLMSRLALMSVGYRNSEKQAWL